MAFSFRLMTVTLFVGIAYTVAVPRARAQAAATDSEIAVSLPDAPEPQNSGAQSAASQTSGSSAAQQTQQVQPAQAAQPQAQPAQPNSDQKPKSMAGQQPKRILGLMPNYRAVSAGTIPPPPTPRQAFKIATQNSFDYSAFVFVGLTSMLAEGEDAHKQLGKGVPGFGRYYWRGYLDKTDGNYWVIFALPTALHEDERYYAQGTGKIWKRALYSSTRVVIARDYHGHDTINGAELLGRGIAQGISTTYYPSADRTASALAAKYGYALLRDAATNTFREFWPDIAIHVLHRHP